MFFLLLHKTNPSIYGDLNYVLNPPNLQNVLRGGGHDPRPPSCSALLVTL